MGLWVISLIVDLGPYYPLRGGQCSRRPLHRWGGSLGPPAAVVLQSGGGRTQIPTPVPQEGRGVEWLLGSKEGATEVNDGILDLWLVATRGSPSFASQWERLT